MVRTLQEDAAPREVGNLREAQPARFRSPLSLFMLSCQRCPRVTARQNMATVELTLARLREAQAIARMSRDLVEVGLPWSWTSARVSTHIRSTDSNVLIAKDDGQLAGFAIMQFYDEHAHLNLLAVSPTYRGFGLGRQLVNWQEDTARAGGMFAVHLEVRANNAGARAFYHRLGYREVKRVPGYYQGREDAIRMTHDLTKHKGERHA